jgi:hypothetical protein
MRQPLAVVLRQAYSAIQYGYSIQNIVYKRRAEDGLVGWADWALRRQESFDHWEMKNGRVVGWTQRPAPTYELATIPLDARIPKAIHLVIGEQDGTPEGRSALRGMYRLYYYVKNFEWMLGVALERFGTGLPSFKRTDTGVNLSTEQEDALAEYAKAIRQSEEAFILLPPGIDFQFVASPGLSAEVYLNVIQRYRVWMLATALADGIALGSESGSYALGKDKTELLLLSLNGYQDRLTTTLDRSAMEGILRANSTTGDPLDSPFGKLTDRPTFTLPAVKRYDLQSLGTFLTVLQRIGAFHPTPEDEAHLRRIAEMVDIPVEQLEEMHEADDAQAPPPPPPTEGQPQDDAPMMEEQDAPVDEEMALEDATG